MTDFEPEPLPLPALAKLHELAAKAATDRGLIVRQFFMFPNIDPDGPHLVHVITQPDPDFEKVEQTSDPEFDRVMREAEMAEQEEKTAKARESLTALRESLDDKNKGLGFDD